MKDPDEPLPIAEDEAAPAGLRDVLRGARADVGSDAQVARLGAKLGPLLGPAAPVAPAGASLASSLTAKLGLGALALLVAGGGAWLLSAPTTSAPSPAPTPSAAPRSENPAVPRPNAPPPPLAAPSVTAEPTAPATPSVAKPSRPTPPAALSEAELLEQARAALKGGDSARALQRATEHAQRYPRGVLVQEREVLAIQALRRLGRDAEADRRAESFSKAYPGSAFQRKLQR